MEPERSEVIHGPNLGGFLGLAPDLRRSGQQGLAWLWNAGTGLGIWHFPKSGSGCDPAGNGSPQTRTRTYSSHQDSFSLDCLDLAVSGREIFSSPSRDRETPPESIL